MRSYLKAQILNAEFNYLTILNSIANIIQNKVFHSRKFSHTPDQVGIQKIPLSSFSYDRLGLLHLECHMNGVPLCVWFLLLSNVEYINTLFSFHFHILFFCVSILFYRQTFNSFFIFQFLVTHPCVEFLRHEYLPPKCFCYYLISTSST